MTAEHPVTKLTELTAEELDKNHSILLRRWQIARQMQMGQDVLHQLDLMLNSIETEKERRARIDESPDGVIMETDPIILVQSNYIGKK